MLGVAWKRFSAGIVVILVGLLVVSNAYAIPPNTTPDTALRVFIAADLTPHSTVPVLPSEILVVLQADGSANDLEGTLFLFNALRSCRVSVPAMAVSGKLFTDSTTGIQRLAFKGFEPPDPCIELGPAMVKVMIGPAFTPPDPCTLTFRFLHGTNVTYTGETVRFIVANSTTTTTTSTTTSPS